MRGLDVIDVYIPADPRSHPVFGPDRAWKELTADMNTSVSCIAVLRELWSDSARMTGGPEDALDVYHNPLAEHPLDPSHLVGRNVTHYRFDEKQTSRENPLG